MAARLKKRLGNAGIDINNPKINESFCLIGTPLPPLEKTRDTGEFVPLWKQDVRDEQGRRRLHGAFTGGFSAGYYNTVGSKEGWTPSTFKSSRNDRSAAKVARPEDFMDEEDLAELKESQKLVDSTEPNNILGGTAGENLENDSIAAALQAVIPPLDDSVGAQLLKKMGWRPGQGIGRRLTYEEMKQRNEKEGLPTPAIDDLEATKHTYAPRETRIPKLSRKDDFHGLGYVAMEGLRNSKDREATSGPHLSTGFGLGALNDADDDDVDIYDNQIRSNNRRLAFEAGDDEDDRNVSTSSRHSTKQASLQSGGFFKNGAPLLSGFVITHAAVLEQKRFEAPVVPEGWKPDPTRVWDPKGDEKAENKNEITNSSDPIPHQQWKKGITAEERGSMLGEPALPAVERSVWDFLSAKDRERLKGFKPTQDAPKPSAPPVAIIEIPRTDPPVAKAALLGFQPFKENPAKQGRYTAYLLSQSNLTPLEIQPLQGQSVSDFNAELEGFSKAAQIFKPMSAAMASRFKSSSIIESTPTAQEGLYQPTDESYAAREAKGDTDEKMEIEETPMEHAARMGMFGALTREQQEWAPAKLLCKRFKVPYPKLSQAETQEDTQPRNGYAEATANESFVNTAMELEPAVPGSVRVVAAETDSSNTGPKDIANIGLGEDDSQGKDTLTYERPSMDIFKAIFASDDEDSDDEKPEDVQMASPKLIPSELASMAVKATSAPETSSVVDLSTFKPTFVSRSARQSNQSSTEKPRKSSKKSKIAGPVSFVTEEDDGQLNIVPIVKKRKREKDDGKESKKRKEKPVLETVASDAMVVDEEDEWVEKKVELQTPNPVIPTTQVPTTKIRPKAADFL